MNQLTADWINTPATQAVCAALTEAGHQVYFVGGCVRNALLGAPVNDIDLATDARPEVVMQLEQKAGFKVVPTGIDHGTVTVIAHHIPHEITTFRRDIETDGRRAVVAYSESIVEDARRRDFTMNALYTAPDGTIIDPLLGMNDLKARRVRFIEEAEQRIIEDYLRILRFFRFHAWYGDPAGGLDADGLAAIAANLDGLAGLSAERVGSEIKKLLSAPDPAPAVAAMRATGVLGAVFTCSDDRGLAPLIHLEEDAGVAPEAMRRLAALGVGDVAKTLRLSRAERARLSEYQAGIDAGAPAHALGYRFGFEVARGCLLLRAALLEMPLAPDAFTEAERGSEAVFPIKAADLMPAYSGVALGKQMRALEERWIAARFEISREALLKA
jgi:poly(A) polymerase